MKLRKCRLVPLVLLAVPGAAPMAIAASPPVKMLADTCAQCHGTDGRSVGSIDRLYGASADKIEREMLASKYHDKGRIMAPIAKAYTDEQIRQIARYFAALPERR